MKSLKRTKYWLTNKVSGNGSKRKMRKISHFLYIHIGLFFCAVFLASVPARAQFFNEPAFAMVALIGQKSACSTKFPDLKEPLHTAYLEFSKKNESFLPAEELAKMEDDDKLGESDIFKNVTHDGCMRLIEGIPKISLKALADEQAKRNEQRRQYELENK